MPHPLTPPKPCAFRETVILVVARQIAQHADAEKGRSFTDAIDLVLVVAAAIHQDADAE